MTNLAWDPSGRFVAAWSSSWAHSIENGYRLFEFTGNMLKDNSIDHFKEFIWRPRPASLLNAADRKRSERTYVNIVLNLMKLMPWRLMPLVEKLSYYVVSC